MRFGIAAFLSSLIAIWQTGNKPVTKLEPLKQGPVVYFEGRCSRCHGPQGTFYGDDFGKNLSEEKLRKVVSDMCENQGQQALEGKELEAQIAFHRALIVHQPFLVLTESPAGIVRGEVTAKANVVARIGGRDFPVKVNRGAWEFILPKGAKPQDVTILAAVGTAKTELQVGKQIYTHGEPIIQGKEKQKP